MLVDLLDRQLTHALYLDARAPFSRLGEVLRVSDQTVARRYRRLQERHGLHVVGRLDPRWSGRSEWVIRLRCAPGTARTVADLLARRPDTHWVRIGSGGAEVIANVASRSDDDRDALLLDKLPSTRSTAVLSAQCVTHVYRGGTTTWRAITDALSSGQVRRLTHPAGTPGTAVARPGVEPADESLLAELGRDGRASHVALALATGRDQSTVRRRIAELRAGGALYFDLDLDADSLGYHLASLLWVTAEPARLDAVGHALADLGETPFVAATTGSANLLVSLLSRGPEHLHRQLTTEVGTVRGVRHVETAPILRTVKRTARRPG